MADMSVTLCCPSRNPSIFFVFNLLFYLFLNLCRDPPRNLSGISVDQLSVFENVKEITNFLVIQGQHDQFVNLSFLSNLVTIYGRNLDG